MALATLDLLMVGRRLVMSNLKELFIRLNESGFFDFGNVITEQEILDLFDLKKPTFGSYEAFKEFDLKLLGITAFFRNQLIKEGKYLKQTNGDYRVLLPSENAKIIELLYQSANRKLQRGIRLAKNTKHHTNKDELNQNLALSVLKRTHIQEAMRSF